LFLASFYLAKYVALGLAFVPVYLGLVNAAAHVLTSVRLRTYNPGLYTSVLLFLPWVRSWRSTSAISSGRAFCLTGSASSSPWPNTPPSRSPP